MNFAKQTRSAGRTIPVLCVLVLAVPVLIPAQQVKTPDISPRDLIKAVVANEIAAAKNSSVKFMFRSRRTSQKGVQNRIYVEANEAMASMLVGQGDQPLSEEQERTEMDQLAQTVNHPDRLHRKQEHEKQEMEHTLRIMRALPDALCYEYAPPQPGDNEPGENQVVRLNFGPNSSYSPPSAVEQVLEGMQGYVLVDAKARRLVRIDGMLFKEVSFGWGIFGHLDKGGTFRVQQTDAGDGNWMITEMSLRLTGKILLLKSLNLNSNETFSDFQRMPDDLPFAKAVEMLQTERTRLAQSAQGLRPAGQ